MTCTACARAHLVNPKTDKWLAFELIVAMRAKRVLVPDASFFQFIGDLLFASEPNDRNLVRRRSCRRGQLPSRPFSVRRSAW